MTNRPRKSTADTGDVAAIRRRIELESDDIRAVALGLGFSIFSGQPWSERPAIALAAVDRFIATCGKERLGFYATETMSKHRKSTAATFSMLATWLKAGAPPRERISLELKGGDVAFDASSDLFNIYAIESGSEHYDPADAAALAVSFDPALPPVTPELIEQWFIDVCTSTDLISGYAGYRMNCSWYDAEESQTHAWRVGMRHRGADIPMLPEDAIAVARDGVKGVGWLTAVGTAIADEVGGASGLRKVLPNAVVLRELPNGLLLKLGPEPVLGDRNRGDAYELERAVHRVLTPAIERFVARAAPFDLESDEVERTDQWLRRFAGG